MLLSPICFSQCNRSSTVRLEALATEETQSTSTNSDTKRESLKKVVNYTLLPTLKALTVVLLKNALTVTIKDAGLLRNSQDGMLRNTEQLRVLIE